MKPELLSPAGNYECLIMAVQNGADAVYLAGKSFGARKFAGNFTLEELKEAVSYAHLYGVKVYVTVNIIVYEAEIDELTSYIKYLYEIGVDALIMQDIGMISMIKKMFPNMEIHASTQAHNHNDFGLTMLKELGCSRVVLDREMSLEEIKSLTTDIKKEVFVHGALCISYSGCCLFSSMNGGRSGNRGECVQSCRLPYRLMINNKYVETDKKYILSTKELNSMENIEKLIEAGIDSFKIEGRMKSSSYVGYVTRLYRKLIDNYYLKKEEKISDTEYDNLKVLFNRDFTNGYLFNDNIMNCYTSNHQGLEIGKVIDVDNKKIKVRLNKPLYQFDGIRFKESNLGMTVNMMYNEKGLLINHAKTDDIIYLDNKINLKKKDILVKTSSKYLEEQIGEYTRKVNIDVAVKAHVNDKLYVSFSDRENTVYCYGNVIEKAINKATCRTDIEEKLSKLGNTVFKVKEFDIDLDDDIFINMTELNSIRRLLVDKLMVERTKIKRENIINKRESLPKGKAHSLELTVLARTKEQVEASLRNNIDRIYVDEKLYDIYRDNKNVYLRLPIVMNGKTYNAENVLVTELGSIKKYQNSNMVSDYYLNVINNYSIDYLKKQGVKRVTISVEMSDNDIEKLDPSDIELIIYGRIELMVMKYCPLKEVLNYCPNCKGNNDKFYLVDAFDNKYPIIHDNCLTHIMHYKNIDKIDNISKYLEMGINSYRIELFDEDESEVKSIINKIRNKIKY